MDNNEVYALFEGIKNDLKGINGSWRTLQKQPTINQTDNHRR